MCWGWLGRRRGGWRPQYPLGRMNRLPVSLQSVIVHRSPAGQVGDSARTARRHAVEPGQIRADNRLPRSELNALREARTERVTVRVRVAIPRRGGPPQVHATTRC